MSRESTIRAKYRENHNFTMRMKPKEYNKLHEYGVAAELSLTTVIRLALKEYMANHPVEGLDPEVDETDKG